jgi:IclR family acetate operon transcriptional repressor
LLSATSRTLAILEELSNQPKGATVSELVMRLGIEKSIVSRILATLEQESYVVREDASDSFQVGLRFAAIALRHIDETGVSDLCLPILRKAAQKSGELVQLAIVQNEQMIYVAKAEGQQRIRVLSLLGRSAVLHASAAGKVWLASLPEQRALALALKDGRLEKFTEHTIIKVDQLRADLAQVRKNKFATVDQELFDGACAVGVPVTDRRDERVLGAVILSGPTYRLQRKRLVSFVPLLQSVANELTELGNIDIHFGHGARIESDDYAEDRKQA